jgi:hypothetical protein
MLPALLSVAAVFAADPTSGGMASVTFYRYKQFQGSGLEPTVYCDEAPLARMDNGRYFVVSIPQGKHVFRSNDAQSGLELDALAGKEYYIRVEIATGMLKGHGRLIVTPSEQGAYEAKKLKLLDADKVKDTSRVSITGIAQSAPQARREGILSNNDILALKAAGLGDDLIVAKIKASLSEFNLDTENIVALKKANVSDGVISEMMSSAKKGK